MSGKVEEQITAEQVDEPTATPTHTSGKPEEELTSAADDQQTEVPSNPTETAECGDRDTSELNKQATESKENIPVEPPSEAKEEDTSSEEPSTLLTEAEQETKTATKDMPQPIAETTLPSNQVDSHQTNGSTIVAPPQVVPHVVEGVKSVETPIEAAPKDNDSVQKSSTPEPVEAKTPDDPVTQQPNHVETGETDATATTKQPEIIISRDPSDEPVVPAAEDANKEPARSTLGEEEQSSSSPAASPNMEVATQDASGAEGSRPATASKSLSSIQIHKKQGFFKALWRAVFVNFLGGLFAPFRRRRNHESAQN